MDRMTHENTQNRLLKEFLTQWEREEGIRVKTSGSTGTPKEIILTRDQIKRSAKRTINHFGINKSSVLHSAVSFEFIGGKMMIARSIISGCMLTFSEPSLSPQLPDKDMKIDLMSVVPAQIPGILRRLPEFRNVKKFLLGGSSIDSRLWNKIVDSGIRAWESYGMTETASHIALRRISGDAESRPRFVPLNGVTVKTDFEGRIHIKDNDTFFTTNDFGKVYPDGSFNILGRMDDMIITGGLKVNPIMIEDKLRPYLADQLKDYFITSVDDEQWSSKIILAGVPVSTEETILPKSLLIQKIKEAIDNMPTEVLPSRYQPKEIRLLEKLPLTASGKLLRRINKI